MLTPLQAICIISFPMDPQYEELQKRKFQDSKNTWLRTDLVDIVSPPAKSLGYKELRI